MALIPQAKCSRCDRKYSGLRARCPFCGTRRFAKSAKSVPADHAVYKIVLGSLVMVALITAVVTLVVTSQQEQALLPTPSVNPVGIADPSQGVTTIVKDSTDTPSPSTETPDPATTEPGATEPGTTEPGTAEPTTTPTLPVIDDPSASAVTSVVMTYGGRLVGVVGDNGMREFSLPKKDETIQLGVKVTPEGVDYTAIWESSDESVALVNQSGKVTWVSVGKATLKVTVDDHYYEVLVRCIR